MTKEHIIRQVDAKEYINFQFQGLIQTLEQFDYPTMATVVKATQQAFNTTTPNSHNSQPDCILLEKTK